MITTSRAASKYGLTVWISKKAFRAERKLKAGAAEPTLVKAKWGSGRITGRYCRRRAGEEHREGPRVLDLSGRVVVEENSSRDYNESIPRADGAKTDHEPQVKEGRRKKECPSLL
ncbi:hypothetical protein AXG93_1847s1330 [Marchantia polymorpha subsp. ruderalis]|uniref:Uncharacterized protein n=1 Tax=Marchantia polymorpha subsp. ruderalis TaxID=1480154 RepID=A0A176VH57_MARPO|nr:hypothetical protein AXG93_1847s1330 [Marchantia polymorpha subsp. ruderalis]